MDLGFKREGRRIWALTVQKDRGRKNMLTKAKSLTFSPSLVDSLLSITALALNSCEKKANISPSRHRALQKHDRKPRGGEGVGGETYGVSQSLCRRQFLPEVLALILQNVALSFRIPELSEIDVRQDLGRE